MLSDFRRTGRRLAAPAGAPARRSRPRVEALEERMALSLGSEFGVVTLTGNQYGSANASAANGMSVAVWVNKSRGIDAQLYNASGGKQGGVIAVDHPSSSTPDELPTVAMDATGNFVVAWDRSYSGGSDTDVLAARFNRNGARLGGTLSVATTSKSEFEPSVAEDRNGNFVVAYTLQYSTSDQDVKARMYNASGGSIQTISVSSTGDREQHPSVSRAPDGRFAVAYQRYDSGGDPDIYLKRYSASGSLVNSHTIANTGAPEYSPKVAMDNNGNSVVVWYAVVDGDRDVFARRVSNNGIMGSKISVRATGADELNPAVAIHHTNGSFVVAYQVGFSGSKVQVSEVSASNSVHSPVATGTGRRGAALSVDGNNEYFLTYTFDYSASDSDIKGRFGRIS